MVNSLDLDPEWGAIDLLEEVEATFGIKIANEEAERCETVGDLYDVLCRHTPDWDSPDGSCGSSMVFYRMRRSLSPADKRRITPETPLTACGLPPGKLFKKLADDTRMRLPSLRLTWLGMTGLGLLMGGILAALLTLLNGNWGIGGIAALIAFAGLPLLLLDPGRFPPGLVTVGDLVRRTVALNAVSLKDAGARPADRWSVLVALSGEHGEMPPEQIGPETFFHRKSSELASGR